MAFSAMSEAGDESLFDVFDEEIVSLVDHRHALVTAAPIGMETQREDLPLSREVLAAGHFVNFVEIAERLRLELVGQSPDVVEEGRRQSIEMALELALGYFLPQCGAGHIARHELENVSPIEVRESAESLEFALDALVAKPEHTEIPVTWAPSHFELVIINADVAENLPLLHQDKPVGPHPIVGSGNHSARYRIGAHFCKEAMRQEGV